ncbi:MAG: hypothetical protein NT002_07495 [candidate division Zixibacteria bacterium]|nr:hypothetical protein [candidate division Zixibacteria bacterium]
MVRRLLRQAILITASLILAAGNYLYAGETAAGTQLPELVTIRTACNRITLNNCGNLGHQGMGGYNFNFFNDCDTTENYGGQNDNATIYLYDASPFLLRVKGNNPGDTILNSCIYDADSLYRNGFRPVGGLTVDSSQPDYQYAQAEFMSHDSAIAVTCEYWMPLHPDTCGMLIQKMRVFNRTASALSNVMIGELMDWDVPSDSDVSGVENGSEFDTTRQLMWCFGAEYGLDSIANNDCVPADMRAGGFAYLNGYKLPAYNSADRFGTVTGMFTGLVIDWIYRTHPTGNFIPQQLYNKLNTFSGYQPWVSTQPTMEDSLYQDLILVAYFGKKNLGVNDTLVWIKVLAAEYDGGALGLKARVDKAKQWWRNRFNIAPKVIDPGEKWAMSGHPISFTVSSFDLDGDPINLTATGLPESSTFTDNGNGTGAFNWTPPDSGHFSFMVTASDGKATGSQLIKVTVIYTCCVVPGDANHDGKVDIRDITCILNFMYHSWGCNIPCKGGPGKYPEADANCNGITNIADVTYLIKYLYGSGPAPICGPM